MACLNPWKELLTIKTGSGTFKISPPHILRKIHPPTSPFLPKHLQPLSRKAEDLHPAVCSSSLAKPGIKSLSFLASQCFEPVSEFHPQLRRAFRGSQKTGSPAPFRARLQSFFRRRLRSGETGRCEAEEGGPPSHRLAARQRQQGLRRGLERHGGVVGWERSFGVVLLKLLSAASKWSVFVGGLYFEGFRGIYHR